MTSPKEKAMEYVDRKEKKYLADGFFTEELTGEHFEIIEEAIDIAVQARTEEIIKTIFTNLKHIFTYVDKDGRTAIYSREVQKLREEVEEKFLSGKERFR